METIQTGLHRYIETDETFYSIYEKYRPNIDLVKQVAEIQPAAHVVTPSRSTCGDCIRNIPAMARIAEYLSGWTWEVYDSADKDRSDALEIVRIPTFIVFDAEGGREIGRIVENPTSGSLESDLLTIVQAG